MNTGSLVIGGTANASLSGVWSTVINTNDQVVISGTWNGGSSKTLTVQASDVAGNALASAISSTVHVLEHDAIHVATTGNDSNFGTEDSPLLTIPAAFTASDRWLATSIYVATGTYTVISAADLTAHLYGGYSSGNWAAARNTAENQTIVNTSSTWAGQAATPNCVFSAWSGFTLDGFTINGPASATYSCGVYFYNANPTITHNYIYGGDGTNKSAGIWASTTQGGIISNNTINGQSTWVNPSYVYGIYFTEGAYSGTIADNIITGGSSTTKTAAIYLSGTTGADAGCGITIDGNTLNGGSGSATSYGIYAGYYTGQFTNNTVAAGSGSAAAYGVYFHNKLNTWGNVRTTYEITGNTIYGGTGANTFGIYARADTTRKAYHPIINRNKIHGGLGTSTAWALQTYTTSAYIYNNYVYGGTSQSTVGISDYGYDNNFGDYGSYIWNNTIDAGQASVDAVGVYSGDTGVSQLMNNLIVFSGGGGSKLALSFWADSTNGTLTNNAFKGQGTVYSRRQTATNYVTVANLQSLAQASGNFDNASGGNAAFNLTTAGAPSSTWTGADYSLTAGSGSNIKTGGIAGPSAFTFTTDLLGVARTAGWSLGAFEQNN